MSNKVFIVVEEFDNCEDYEARYLSDRNRAVTKTKDEAEKIVKDLYDKILSIKTDEFGREVMVELRREDDGSISDVLVTNVKGCSRMTGSYSYWIEEFELGKVKDY